MPADFIHQPVLLQETLDALAIRADGRYLDCTFGRGGHARAMLARLNQHGALLALDQDPEAVAEGQRLAAQDPRFHIEHQRFDQLAQAIQARGWSGRLDGILFDLGVSSPQLDDPARGFSFLRDGPLDMRMNPGAGESAADWLARATEREIADVFYTYGEERHSRRIARAIKLAQQQAEIETTAQLASIIATAHPRWEPGKHPATQSFQAIRIFLNRELDALALALPQALAALAPGGRLAVIAFHSLEDRLVKRFIRDQARGDDLPPGVPVTTAQLHPTLRPLGKAIHASEEEREKNPRARSAVLRAAERLKDN